MHAKPAGSGGQSYHKDGFFPGGGHGLRYHRPEYVLFFYYPQDTTETMGPTEILPQSQYLSNDNEPQFSPGLLTQGVPGVPPDPFAPSRGPPWILSRQGKRNRNRARTRARTLGSTVRPTAAH
jgi:hypothetical protein